MKAPRWLLPFTHGVNMCAIDTVVGLAESGGATLVAVSLISATDARRPQDTRLEHMQQSKDFLEAVKWKATRHEVALERYEVFTIDVTQSITRLIRDLHCDSVVLVSSGEEALLQAHEMERLLTEPPASLVLIRLPARTSRTSRPHLGARLLSWLRRPRGQQDVARTVQEEPAVEEPSCTSAQELHRG